MVIEPSAEPVQVLLARALGECRRALGDYQSGNADGAELRRRLVTHGMVAFDDEVWILDLDAARWCRFDGLSITRAPVVLDDTQVGRWRTAIDRLQGQLGRPRGDEILPDPPGAGARSGLALASRYVRGRRTVLGPTPPSP